MFEIPYFSLQPLVENAIEHGLLPLENGGVLELTCTSDEKMFIIEIKDNGIGMTKEQLAYVQDNFKYADANNQNVGLHNSCRRFKLMFGDRLNYKIDSEYGIGTSITIEVLK
ncbi:MAG: ATP-binding protein [Tissierellaceae bacterium]|nr:ATP-binding protein [Tissierellaceae bacterium]